MEERTDRMKEGRTDVELKEKAGDGEGKGEGLVPVTQPHITNLVW